MNKTTDQPASSSFNRKSSVYVSGFAPEVDEEQLLQAFVTFGDIIEIKIPHEPHDRTFYVLIIYVRPDANLATTTAKKHRGYAFITFSSAADAQEAIDNYDLNQLPGYQGSGKFLKCSLAQPSKYVDESGRNDRASEWTCFCSKEGENTNERDCCSLGDRGMESGTWRTARRRTGSYRIRAIPCIIILLLYIHHVCEKD